MEKKKEIKTANFKIQKRFLVRWILATGIAWPVGIFLGFVLSYAIVNLFYPKETNLILGLCIGTAVGFAQWLVLKKSIKKSGWWILYSAIGIGTPFIVEVILEEAGIVFPGLFDNVYLSWFIIGCIGGFLNGLLQMSIFNTYLPHSGWWIGISTIGWGIAFLSFQIVGSIGLVVGGVILGAITGPLVLCLLKFPVEGPVD